MEIKFTLQMRKSIFTFFLVQNFTLKKIVNLSLPIPPGDY